MKTKTAPTAVYYPTIVRDFRAVQGDPEPITEGMHATMSSGSDAYPYEVVKIIDSKTIEVRRLESRLVKPDGIGMGNGEHEFTSNEGARTEFARLVVRRGQNLWCRASQDGRSWDVNDFNRFSFGLAVNYRDPSF